jgi:hypothetical protein
LASAYSIKAVSEVSPARFFAASSKVRWTRPDTLASLSDDEISPSSLAAVITRSTFGADGMIFLHHLSDKFLICLTNVNRTLLVCVALLPAFSSGRQGAWRATAAAVFIVPRARLREDKV